MPPNGCILLVVSCVVMAQTLATNESGPGYTASQTTALLTSLQTQLFSVTAVSLNSDVSYSHWEQAETSALPFTAVFLYFCILFYYYNLKVCHH